MRPVHQLSISVEEARCFYERSLFTAESSVARFPLMEAQTTALFVPFNIKPVIVKYYYQVLKCLKLDACSLAQKLQK